MTHINFPDNPQDLFDADCTDTFPRPTLDLEVSDELAAEFADFRL